MWEKMNSYIDHQIVFTGHIGWDILKIVVMIILARIGVSLVTRIANRAILMNHTLEIRRKNTLRSIISNLIKYTIYFILLVTILPILGIQIGALLAGAGVVGITVAFGAQNLIKDFFNGFFILLEDQFGVGDLVEINHVTGEVHSLGLRVTCIKIWTGETVFIPNSQITQVINYSKNNSMAVIDINIGYNTEIEQASAIIQQVMDTLKKENPETIHQVSVLGVQALNDSNFTIRATAETMPLKHWSIQSLAKQRIHTAFMLKKIDLPIQKMTYIEAKQP